VNMLSVAVVAAVLLAGISAPADATQTSTILRARYGPRLLLRGGYGSDGSGSGTDTSWASLPRRAYKWMAEGWRRIRNPRAGKEARAGESAFSGGSGKRRAPATDTGAGAISPESKRRRKEMEGGASTARTEALPLRGGRSKGFGSTSKTLAKAGTVSESAPRADQADPGSKAKTEVAGMSAQELLREAEKIKSCGDGLYTIEKVCDHLWLAPELFLRLRCHILGVDGDSDSKHTLLCRATGLRAWHEGHCQLLRQRGTS
jgi:hypothetical protein